MATKFKKKNVEKRGYKKEGVLKVNFNFLSKLKFSFTKLQNKFLDLKN
jgi:hypothetical protein